MKELIITIGLLSGLNYQTDGTRVDYTEKIKLAHTIDHIQDMKEWMMQDIESGRVNPELGEHYIYWLDVTEDELIEFVNNNRITTPDPECMGYEVLRDGTVVNFKY